MVMQRWSDQFGTVEMAGGEGRPPTSHHNLLMNQSSAEGSVVVANGPPITNYADNYFGEPPNFDCFIRSQQALSHHSEK